MLNDGWNWILAQAQAPAEQPAPKVQDFWVSLLPLLPIVILFYFLLIRPQRQEQAKRDQMLNTMKKNDRVVTTGGILGTVANISPDGKEITLKVDDNTRIKFLRSSIQQVLGEESKDDAAAKTA